MPGFQPYSMTLPKYTMVWMWWIWTYSSGLSALNTTLWYTCTSPQTEIPHQALHQMDFSPLSPGKIQTQQIKVTVPSPQISQSQLLWFLQKTFQVTSWDIRHHHRSTSWCPHSSNYCSHHDTPHHRSSSHRSSSTYSWYQSRSRSHSAYKPSKQALHKSSKTPQQTSRQIAS